MSSPLTHIITQTHRHFVDNANVITVDDARISKFPLFAECGTVWIPGSAEDVAELPMCGECERRRKRGLSTSLGDSRPTYVYRLYDHTGRLIYVGCSVSPMQRMDQHRANSWWFEQVARTRFIVFPTREYALAMEREAIATENPRWNVRGRDRSEWSVEDYVDAHFVMLQSGANQKRINRLRLEANRRFDVDLTELSA